MRVFVLGDVNMDLAAFVDHFPTIGEDVRAGGYANTPGGGGLNVAVAYSKLDDQAPYLISCVGADYAGDQIVHRLSQIGISSTYISRSHGVPTGQILVIVTPDGERTMVSCRGANEHLSPDTITPDLFEPADGLIVSGYSLLRSPQMDAASRAIQIAHQAGAHVLVDTARDPAIQFPKRFQNIFPWVDTLVVGKEDGMALTGAEEENDMFEKLIEMGIGQVALKKGRLGCVLADHEDTIIQPGFPVKSIDSTGAGDAFSAGLLFATLRGLPLPERAVMANALGAFATTFTSAGINYPAKKDFITFLDQLQMRKLNLETRSRLARVISLLKGN